MKTYLKILLVLVLVLDVAHAANEFWVTSGPWPAMTVSAVFPAGSQINPFDGTSAAKFDASMQAIPPASLIHLSPGTFQTIGSLGWGPKTGQHIVGAGMGLTVLQFPAAAVLSGALNLNHVICPQSLWETNITISDLTVDCNFQSNLDLSTMPGSPGVFTLNGISLHGSDNTIERVHCINAVAWTSSATNYAEAWGIFMNEYPFTDALRNRIEDCQVSDSHSNFHNNLSALGFLGGSGIIAHNFITQTGTNLVFGILPGIHDSVIDGNILLGVMIGSHLDTSGSATNQTWVNNQFINCNTAIDWENGTWQDITIANNNIVLTNTAGVAATVTAIYLHPTVGTNVASAYYNVAIYNNSARLAGTNQVGARFVLAYNAPGLMQMGNRVDSRLPSLLVACPLAESLYNLDLNGKALAQPQVQTK